MTEYLPVIKNVLAILCPFIAAALAISERMALNPATQNNGIVHFFRLAREYLRIVPPEMVKAIEAVAPATQVIFEEAGDEKKMSTGQSAPLP